MSAFDPQKYGLSGGVWILVGLAALGLVALGSYLMQTHQRLSLRENELDSVKRELVRANTKAAVITSELGQLRVEIEAANAARNTYKSKLDKADTAIAELTEQLDMAHADLARTQSQLQDLEASLETAKQAADRAKTEAAEGEKQIAELKEQIALQRQTLNRQVERLEQAANQAHDKAVEREKEIAKLQQGMASCEDFFTNWEMRGAPTSLTVIAGLGREASAAKDCLARGDVATACKHWQGLIVEIGKMGSPLRESLADIDDLMRQHQCEAVENSAAKEHRP